MEFIYGPDPDASGTSADFHTFLSCNGLGGYCSLGSDGAVTRCDQGVLVSAERSPNLRIGLVHRLRDRISGAFLSTQSFADGSEPEVGRLTEFRFGTHALWRGRIGAVSVTRECGMGREVNAAAVTYHIINSSSEPCTLTVEPMLKLAPKEEVRTVPCELRLENGRIRGGGWQVFVKTDGAVTSSAPRWELLSYPEDAKDGRPDRGLAGSCCEIRFSVPGHSERDCEILFSQHLLDASPRELLRQQDLHLEASADRSGIRNPVGRQLAMAADAYISRRDSTGGKTILAGYPLFSDWGRDTMIALRGCCLSAKRFDDAGSILKTFLQYEKDGLMPNLFPEGGTAPMYNTADAALLLIDSIWQYYGRTRDLDFVREAFPVMERIIGGYRRGTHHGIRMDTDGLILAGQGYDQVTWMDVRIGDILPTPRHGKPVEINAYWYNALRIMERLGTLLGKPGGDFGSLADRVRKSFLEKFYIPEKGYLKDVLSGTEADTQIRCNQIWAVSQTFSMLDEEQARNVVNTVKDHLFTDHGLRSLSPRDPQYHPHYGGDQLQRDLAYHQGTVWVFPLGAFYLAWMKVYGSRGVRQVRGWLASLEDMLREGCAGQLPEIYDGDCPHTGKGCFAQAWSVGEMLTVYEALEEEHG